MGDGLCFLVVKNDSLFFAFTRMDLWLTTPPTLKGKMLGQEADCLPLSSAKFQNDGACHTSVSPYAFMVWHVIS
jgi:hypothetical protein